MCLDLGGAQSAQGEPSWHRETSRRKTETYLRFLSEISWVENVCL